VDTAAGSDSDSVLATVTSPVMTSALTALAVVAIVIVAMVTTMLLKRHCCRAGSRTIAYCFFSFIKT